jgi:hypothetical protein
MGVCGKVFRLAFETLGGPRNYTVVTTWDLLECHNHIGCSEQQNDVCPEVPPYDELHNM